VIELASEESQLLGAVQQLSKGSLRKATTNLLSWGVAPDNSLVRSQIQKMNPQRRDPFDVVNDGQFQNWDLSVTEVKNGLMGMRSDAAPGPSGLSVHGLKRVIATEEGARAVTTIVNRIINGTEENSFQLLGAKMVPLIKSAQKIRPIAVGEVLTRLGARILLRRHAGQLSDYLRPMQLGVREPGGTEKIIHSVRREFNGGNAVLTLDISNAFNSLSREAIREALEAHLPSLLPYFQWAYKEESPLWYNGDLIAYSKEGVRQGDPLGPALFAVGFHGVLKELDREFSNVQIFSYLDDVSATGDGEELVQFAQRFRELASLRGLTVNVEKSVLLVPSNQSLPRGNSSLPIRREGIELLGSPVGEANFEGNFCLEKVHQLRKLILLKTEQVVPLQSRYIVLKDAVLPTLNHLWRTVPPWNCQSAITAFDEGIKEAVRVLLGADIFDDGDQVEGCFQVHLPLRLGGLGLTKASSVSTAAYVSSTWERGIILDHETRQMLVSRLQAEGVRLSEEDLQKQASERKNQHLFMEQITQNQMNSWMSRQEDENVKARIRAAQQPGAQDWLGTLPTSSTKSFSDSQWRLAVRLRLGLRVSRESLPRLCPLCEGEIGDFGNHAFLCSYSEMKASRTERHNLLRDVILGGLSAWGYQTQKEPRIMEGSSRRGDISVIQSDGPLIIDVSLIHPSVAYSQQNIYISGATLVRERTKFHDYQNICESVQKRFLPFVFQTLGGIGNKALEFLGDLRSRPPCFRVFQPRNYVFALRQNLSCRLLKMNSDILRRWLQLVLPLRSGGVAVHN
jgi:hypothetical protein